MPLLPCLESCWQSRDRGYAGARYNTQHLRLTVAEGQHRQTIRLRLNDSMQAGNVVGCSHRLLQVAWHGCAGNYKRGTCILRSAQFLRSVTVKRSRKGFALISFSRLVRPVASAFAITSAASASSIAVRTATAPAAPAK